MEIVGGDLMSNADAKDFETKYELAKQIIEGEYEDKIQYAIDMLTPMAKENDVKAQILLAKIYEKQEDNEYRLGYAFKWWAKAAKHGNAEALAKLGELYLLGYGNVGLPPMDLENGIKLLQEAAEKGSENAWNYLFNEFRKDEAEIVIERTCARCLKRILKSGNDELIKTANLHIERLSELGRQKLNKFLNEDDIIMSLYFFYPYEGFKYDDLRSMNPDSLIDFIMGKLDNDVEFTKQLGEDEPLWAKFMAESGEVRYQYALGLHFYQRGYYFWRRGGDSYENYFDKSYYWYKKAAEQNYEPAIKELIKLSNRHDKIDPEDVFYWSNRLFKLGSIDGCFELANCYGCGIGTEKDDAKCVLLMNQVLANRKNTVDYKENFRAAAHNLSIYYSKGDGVEKNEDMARLYLNIYNGGDYESAKNGDVNAVKRIAKSYLTGKGVEKDAYKAKEIFLKYYFMYLSRCATMAYDLAELCHSLEQYEEADEYYLFAANLGYKDAKVKMFLRYKDGIGSPAYNEEGLQLLRSDLKRNWWFQLEYMANWYGKGEGVKRNLINGLECLKQKALADKNFYTWSGIMSSAQSWELSEEEKKTVVSNVLAFYNEHLSGKNRELALRSLFEVYHKGCKNIFAPNLELALKYAKEMFASGDEDLKAEGIRHIFELYIELPETAENALEEIRYYKMRSENAKVDHPVILHIAKHYRMGLGVVKDDAYATKLYIIGSSLSCYPIAAAECYRAYRDGIGVEKDATKAEKYYQMTFEILKKAVFPEWAKAYNIGDEYRKGKYVVKNDEEASFWYRESEKRGEKRLEPFCDFSEIIF